MSQNTPSSRSPKRHNNVPWTPDEVSTLRRLYPDYPAICRALPQYTLSAIQKKSSKLRLSREHGLVPHPTGLVRGYTAEEKAVLAAGGTIPGRVQGSYSWRKRHGVTFDQANRRRTTHEEAERMASEPGWLPEGLSRNKAHMRMRAWGLKLAPLPRPEKPAPAPKAVRPKIIRIRPERYVPAPHAVAAASPRAPGYALMTRLMRESPTMIDHDARLDLVAEVALGVVEGRYHEGDLPAAFKDAARIVLRSRPFQESVSLDAVYGDRPLSDLLGEDRALWQ